MQEAILDDEQCRIYDIYHFWGRILVFFKHRKQATQMESVIQYVLRFKL